MQNTITEIAPGTYRFSTFNPDHSAQFNEFLIDDDEPFLMHTGLKRMFRSTLDGVKSIMDPARLRWIGFSHFESDECGALNELLAVAPHAQAVCSVVGAAVAVNDYADRAPRPLADNEVLQTGRHRLKFLATPHVPHCWDAGLFFEETERTLLCSDLFFHPGGPEPVTTSDIVGRARDAIERSLGGPFANSMPYTPYTGRTLERLAALEPATLALMHGSSFRGECRKAIRDFAGVIESSLGSA